MEQKPFHSAKKNSLKPFIEGIFRLLFPLNSYFIFIIVTNEVATWLSESDPSVWT